MRERLEGYCDQLAAFLWDQFQKDLELSERVIGYFDKAFISVYDFFRLPK
jgi:hypothetical protein